MKIYGYICVSSIEQNEDKLMISMGRLSVPQKNILMDKQSGKDFMRLNYIKMVKKLRQNA